MENQAGKRVIPNSGHAGGKGALILISSLLVLLAAAYIGLCTWVSAGGQILPNTAVSDIELGGLTQEQASSKLQQALASRYSSREIPFTCNGQSFAVSGALVTMDTTAAALDARNVGRTGNFFTMGAALISSLLHPTALTTPLSFSQSPPAIAEADAYVANPVGETTWELKDKTLVLTKGRSGQAIDSAALEPQLLERFQTENYAPLDVPITMAKPQDLNFEAIYPQVYVEPADAYLDTTTKTIVPAVTGVSFDIAAARALLENTAEGDVCSVPLDFEVPSLTTEKLNAVLFRDVLGKAETYCSGPASRRLNIDLASKFVNGTILLPGEVFSYTAHCGPYSQSNGYQKAGAYQNGKTVDTTAGGICQLSSTLYWTTLIANLETVERSQHAYNTGYLPILGTDATVFGDSPDFKFKNSSEYPIKIECYRDKGNKLHVTIMGTNTTGLHGEPYSEIVSTTPAELRYEANAAIPVGSAPKKDAERTAYNGVTVNTYLNLVDKDGNVVSNVFLHKDRYRSRNGVYLYNPADAARLGINPSTGKKTETPVVAPTPVVTPTPSTTPTPGVSPAPVVTPTPGVSPTPVVTPTPGVSPTPVVTPTPGVSPTPVATPSPAVTQTPAPPSAEPLPTPETVSTQEPVIQD